MGRIDVGLGWHCIQGLEPSSVSVDKPPQFAKTRTGRECMGGRRPHGLRVSVGLKSTGPCGMSLAR